MRYVGLFALGTLLLGVGFGWLVFNVVGVTGITIAWLLMAIGVIIIASSLISWKFYPTAGVVTAFSVGLVISLLLSAGIPSLSGVGPVARERAYNLDGNVEQSEVSFELANVNGVVRVSTWSESKYSVSILAIARGWSDGENIDTLSQVSVNMIRRVEGEKLVLVLELNVSAATWRKLDININATLPTLPATDLKVQTTNGDVSILRVNGGDMYIKTTNGAIIFDNANASSIRCSTTNGLIRGTFEAIEFHASSVNGGFNFRIPSRMSGTYRLDLVNGNIDVSVKKNVDNGFSVDLSTVNGRVSLDLPNFSYTTNSSKHIAGQTNEYDASTVKIAISASTVNGNSRVAAEPI